MLSTDRPRQPAVGTPRPGDWYSHPTALVQTDSIGPGTHVWAFCHVMSGATIGADCNLGDHCYVEGGVTIGNAVVVKNGVSLWRGVIVEDGVFIGPNAAFTNDVLPRAKVYRPEHIATVIREGASIGANATVLCGLTVGRWGMVGAGSVVTRDVPDHALVYGNPARVRGFVCRCGAKLGFAPLPGAPNVAHAGCTCGRRYRRIAQIVSEVHD